MDDIELKGQMWWPKHDIHCRASCESAYADISKILEYCPKQNLAIQAGGNVGIWPLWLSAYFSSVLTVEPDPLNYKCLLKNIEDNRKIISFNVGLSDTSDKVDLRREHNNCGSYYVEGKGDIKLITIDSLEVKDCDLICLDIEGYEYMALKGSLRTIQKFKPVIVCEEKGLGAKYEIPDIAIEDLLRHFNYKKRDKIGNDVIYVQ